MAECQPGHQSAENKTGKVVSLLHDHWHTYRVCLSDSIDTKWVKWSAAMIRYGPGCQFQGMSC